jgi:hypothetical protein
MTIGMLEPTHYDIVVILGVVLATELAVGFALFGYAVYAARDLSKMVKESQRLTRAVAGLVVQESDRIRALFDDSRP